MKMLLAVAVCLLIPLSLLKAQQSSNQQKKQSCNCANECPMHNGHSHGTGAATTMEERGEQGMGFSQTATTHHFFIKSDGGVIQVEANDPKDVTNRDNIRMHLSHIAQAFANGDFDIPMFVHDTVPPGVPEMKRLRDKIKYSNIETPTGGRVVITTADSESLTAIHKFLRFQIKEHNTGDPTEIRQ